MVINSIAFIREKALHRCQVSIETGAGPVNLTVYSNI